MGPKALQLATVLFVVQLLLLRVDAVRTKLRKQRSKPVQAQQPATGDYEYDYGYDDDYEERNGKYILNRVFVSQMWRIESLE